jgi:hypothetical protein
VTRPGQELLARALPGVEAVDAACFQAVDEDSLVDMLQALLPEK